MILLADSGSTKTDWCSITKLDKRTEEQKRTDEFIKTQYSQVQTQGINPVVMETDSILRILYKELLPQLPVQAIESIYFYGAGCTSTKSIILKNCLKKVFGEQVHIEVYSDLLGAARALCGHTPGIACIMGTGSNSGFYDGDKIAQHTPSLGYILGDEGSGAYLGKCLINGVLKKQLPADICRDFLNETQLIQEEVIDCVYRKPKANRFLAGFAPFIAKNRSHPAIQKLLNDAFSTFIQRNLTDYPTKLPVHATGSIAYVFKEELTNALKEQGYTPGNIEQSPMKGLITFHTMRK